MVFPRKESVHIVRRLSHPARPPSQRDAFSSLRPETRFVVENAGRLGFSICSLEVASVTPHARPKNRLSRDTNKKAAVPTTGTSG
jgi:hypothetical protein